MLYTNLKHIENESQFQQIVNNNKLVVIICGRMGEASVPVYRFAETLQTEFPQLSFFDVEFDNPESQFLYPLLDKGQKMNLPLVVYYNNGDLVHFTSGIQTKEQLVANIENHLLRNNKI